MGSKQSKADTALDLDTIEELADEDDFAKKKQHLEPDLIGAKLAAKASCAAYIDRDMIFHAGNGEYTHHPAGYRIAPKNGNYYFAQSEKNQPRLPYATMAFSHPYNRKLNGEEADIDLSLPEVSGETLEPSPEQTADLTEPTADPISA